LASVDGAIDRDLCRPAQEDAAGFDPVAATHLTTEGKRAGFASALYSPAMVPHPAKHRAGYARPPQCSHAFNSPGIVSAPADNRAMDCHRADASSADNCAAIGHIRTADQ
jgi:hypothetical protein